MPPIQDHPLRYELANELHARPFPSLNAPCTAVYLAVKQPHDAAKRDRAADLAHLIELASRRSHGRPLGWGECRGGSMRRPSGVRKAETGRRVGPRLRSARRHAGQPPTGPTTGGCPSDIARPTPDRVDAPHGDP